jgi:hypothetical protein
MLVRSDIIRTVSDIKNTRFVADAFHVVSDPIEMYFRYMNIVGTVGRFSRDGSSNSVCVVWCRGRSVVVNTRSRKLFFVP